ncbi:CCCH zinc finger and SMR domain-containing protein [Magnaporthiopsis poae ATCC 64411]|uniref:CCCH zinc finger and SMR domain-containing protein n=1 Tax=Magnaporthiopsis poae (strain ATCC 64411 / 73-15) TaxID=644358 RepID=A0A0C4DMX2_MAGP6|nr:CCCH zinc finger and SMR domain-containing protein [Magnaporthiopsis poae ATCC 64411]
MVSDETYDICLPILEDATLEEEDKTDKLEEVLRKETTLSGGALENAVLDALWRFREGGGTAASPPPIRQTILRRPSPASWRGGSSTPLPGSPRLGVSPLAPPGFIPTPFGRNVTVKSSTASPFGSPRPSPRLAFASPAIPHSPNLNAYEFATEAPSQEIFGDLQADNVDWLTNDDAVSVTSSLGTGSALNAAAPEYAPSQQIDMTPYDMLRSILGQSRTDEEIDVALSMHGYDLGATISAIMESQPPSEAGALVAAQMEEASNFLVGKSMTPDIRPSTPADQRSGVICKFFLAQGQCLRADCRFSHDLSNHVCKYWVAGNCLAGATCIFSHDPVHLMNKLTVDGTSTPPSSHKGALNIQLQDLNSFPSLQPPTPENMGGLTASNMYPSLGITPPPGFKILGVGGEISRPRSRPGSRHQQKEMAQAAPSLDDTEAFPSLGSASAKAAGKKHHGKRGGHGHHKENFTPSSLADIVKMSPSPQPESSKLASRKMGRNGSSTNIRNGENSATAQAIPSPKHIPWLETGDKANKAYLKARQEAIKHGGLRNKFLQSAAQAWNRNDARAAKALSLRGQSENDLMRKAHREAARELYEERNKHNWAGQETYVDLHGLHPEEAVEYLERVLLENEKEARPVYAITGTGHHSKNGKDKVGKAIRNFLNEWRYAYREFSVPGDRSNMGGILGIDARSWDRSLARDGPAVTTKAGDGTGKEPVDIMSQGVEIGEGKVKLLVRDTSAKEPPKGPRGR